MKILDFLFGTVIANKIRMKVGDTHRNPFTQLAISFFKGYAEKFNKAEGLGKFMLIALPFTNFFLLSGLFTFFLVLFIDYCLIRYVIK